MDRSENVQQNRCTLVSRHPDGNHVALDELSKINARVVAPGNKAYSG